MKTITLRWVEENGKLTNKENKFYLNAQRRETLKPVLTRSETETI